MAKNEDMNSDAPPRPTIEDAFSDALAWEFEQFTADPFTRRAVRGSIAGKVKRRELMHLSYLHGVKVGSKASDLMHSAQLAIALGLDPETPWPKLLAHVRAGVSS